MHNFYRQPGDEGVAFEQEGRLFERNGHRVVIYTRSNHEVESSSPRDRLRLLKAIVCAKESRDDIERLLRAERPDSEISEVMKGAAFGVMPSLWYEGLSMSL